MKGRLASLLIVCGFLSFSQEKFGFSSDTSDWTTLDEVQVNALSLSNSRFDYPGAVATIDQKTLSISNPTIAADLVNTIPGVYWHSGALNTNRITIRGIGSRTPFSTNKIRAYYEDIPLTDGGGETSLEDIDLSFVGGIEIQKGANSSIYGSGLGGTIFLKRPSTDTDNYATFSSDIGSFGLLRLGVKGLVKTEKTQLMVGLQHQGADGYRANNAFDRETFFSSFSYEAGKDKIQWLLLFLDQKAFIPSSIGLTDFENNPRIAAQNWQDARGFEDYNRLLLGLSWERTFGDRSQLITSFYTTRRDAYEPRPFNILQEKTTGVGVRSRWEKVGPLLSVTGGFEGYFDTYEFQTFENLFDANAGTGSVQGGIIDDGSQPRGYLNVFFESSYELNEKLSISGGVNLNNTRYRLESRLPNVFESETDFNTIVSPRLAVTYTLAPALNLFGTLSHGFSPPSVDDATNADGSLNTVIEPEIGWNREVGIKHFGARFNYEISMYSMDVRDLLVTRRTAEDVIFGVNAGRTLHNGLEVDFNYLILQTKRSQLTSSLSYSLADYEFKSFVDDQNDFSGNQLTGVPQHQLNISVLLNKDWFVAGFNYQFIDAMPITDDNQVFSGAYDLFNTHIGADYQFGKRWTGNVRVRLHNIFDESYASMLGINARAFGSNEPRYYYPGLPFNYQLSTSLTYRL